MKKAILLLALVAGCMSHGPSIVTVVSPYVAIIPLTDTTSPILGQTNCDLTGEPYIQLRLNLPRDLVPWVLTHERIHIESIRKYPGGCFAFAKRYMTDSKFRLQVEALAFCGVFSAQKMMKQEPNPTLKQIVSVLLKNYRVPWAIDEVVNALPCWEN